MLGNIENFPEYAFVHFFAEFEKKNQNSPNLFWVVMVKYYSFQIILVSFKICRHDFMDSLICLWITGLSNWVTKGVPSSEYFFLSYQRIKINQNLNFDQKKKLFFWQFYWFLPADTTKMKINNFSIMDFFNELADL